MENGMTTDEFNASYNFVEDLKKLELNMNYKEKAKELWLKFANADIKIKVENGCSYNGLLTKDAVTCAIILVDELIKQMHPISYNYQRTQFEYYKLVRKELSDMKKVYY